MNFWFLNPWVWLGAIAIGIPILLHLHRKQPKDLFLFSTIRFLEDQPEPRRSPLRLRDLLLFALRVLALLLILTGFAWPYLRDARNVVVEESRVYVLDNTLSHQVDDGFMRDRQAILDALSTAGPEIQIAVVELTAQPRVIVQFGEDTATAKAKVGALTPSYQRGSYLAGFRSAQLLLENALGEKKRIVLCGDNQENQWTEHTATAAFLDEIEIELPKPAATRRPNVAVSDPRLQRIFLSDKSLIHFTAKLTHTGDAESVQVSLNASGRVILDQTADLADQPKTMWLQAEWESDPTNRVTGNLMVQADADVLPGDNRLYFSLPPLAEGKVALLAQSPFLKLALSPEVMRGRWAVRALEVANLASELQAEPQSDVLCIESSYLQGADARKVLWHYRSNMRGVLLLVDRLTPVVKGYLRELGFEADTAGTAVARHEKVQFVAFNHPIFHPFLSPDYGNLLEIGVSKYANLRSNNASPLMFSERGAPLFFESNEAGGTLLVLAFGLHRDETTWPVHPTFIPFLDLALQSARPRDSIPTEFQPGDMMALRLPEFTSGEPLVLSDGQRELTRVMIEPGGLAKLRVPGEPGVFTLSSGQQFESWFAVNPHPKESELHYIAEPQSLALWQQPRAEKKPGAAVTQLDPTEAAIFDQRFWWWALLGAATALLLEMAVANLKRSTL